MGKKMKVLIGYDGLNPAVKMITDLKRAGLPQNLEALVVTVVDAFVPPGAICSEVSFPQPPVAFVESARKTALARIGKEVEQARKTAKRAADQIHAAFPHWEIRADAFADSPAWGIVKKAGEWDADLVVVGSRKQTKTLKFSLGSVAQKVVNEAPCSVRIVHYAAEEVNSPVRIIIGADGSADSELAVNAVAKREWKKGSAAHLVTVVDVRMSTAPAVAGSGADKWIKERDQKEEDWIHRMSEDFQKKLKPSGLTVTSLVKEGDPKRILIEEAERWGADCVFVGARGLNMFERFFIGSVSSAVAARAHCSVEVVRPKSKIVQPENKYKKVSKSPVCV